MIGTPRHDRSIVSSYRQRTTSWMSISRFMIASVTGWVGTDDLPARTFHDQAVQLRLHLGHLRGDHLTQAGVVAQLLWCQATHQLLCLFDEFIQLSIGAYVERGEPLKELREVSDGRVPEDLAFAVLSSCQALA